MRRQLALLATLALAAATPASADPVGVPIGTAGVVASSNVELIASVPEPGGIGGRFVGDLLYMTNSQGLRIFDTATADGVPVLIGAMPLPHFENEDVDTDGNILLISADMAVNFPGSNLYVIDVSNPSTPLLVGQSLFNDEGHTVSCIPFEGNGCAFAWLAGGRTLPVMDLRDPTSPRQVASFTLPSPDPNNENDTTCRAGGSHDVQLDDAGIAWISAGGGLFGYDFSDPRSPMLVHQNCASGGESADRLHSDFIIHNSLRPNASALDPNKLGDLNVDPGELVLVTEEDYFSGCSDSDGDGLFGEDEGRFQTAWIHTVGGETRLDKIDEFSLGQGTIADGAKPTGAFCSSHYFDHRDDGIVSVAWYEQGVRFMDVSDPRNIRQVGFFMPPVTEAWNAQWKPGTDLVYVFDFARGLDVIRFNGEAGDPSVRAPLNAPSLVFSQPDPRWGYSCRVALPDLLAR